MGIDHFWEKLDSASRTLNNPDLGTIQKRLYGAFLEINDRPRDDIPGDYYPDYKEIMDRKEAKGKEIGTTDIQEIAEAFNDEEAQEIADKIIKLYEKMDSLLKERDK